MGVGFYILLQVMFLTQGSNPCLLSPTLAGGFFTTRATGKPRHSGPESLHPVARAEATFSDPAGVRPAVSTPWADF